jgi:hypothetical protein
VHVEPVTTPFPTTCAQQTTAPFGALAQSLARMQE